MSVTLKPSPQKIQNLLQQAKISCLQEGKKLTSVREAVLEILLQTNQPMSAYELLDEYKKLNQSGSQPMTIYRALAFLEEMQLIHKLASTRQYVVCNHLCEQLGEHAHLTQFFMCHQCGSITESPLPNEVWELIQQTAAREQFVIDQPNLEIHGLCQYCKPVQ